MKGELRICHQDNISVVVFSWTLIVICCKSHGINDLRSKPPETCIGQICSWARIETSTKQFRFAQKTKPSFDKFNLVSGPTFTFHLREIEWRAHETHIFYLFNGFFSQK